MQIQHMMFFNPNISVLPSGSDVLTPIAGSILQASFCSMNSLPLSCKCRELVIKAVKSDRYTRNQFLHLSKLLKIMYQSIVNCGALIIVIKL